MEIKGLLGKLWSYQLKELVNRLSGHYTLLATKRAWKVAD